MWVLSSYGWYLDPGDLDKIVGVSADRDEKKSQDGPLAHFHFKREAVRKIHSLDWEAAARVQEGNQENVVCWTSVEIRMSGCILLNNYI